MSVYCGVGWSGWVCLSVGRCSCVLGSRYTYRWQLRTKGRFVPRARAFHPLRGRGAPQKFAAPSRTMQAVMPCVLDALAMPPRDCTTR